MKKLLNLFLLTVMLFTITHEVVYAQHVDDHCSSEHAFEISSDESHHGENEVCENHCMFHAPFLLPKAFLLEEANLIELLNHAQIHYNSYIYPNNTFRPPIV